ncbi:MAG: hypothetical protein IPK83_16605 [Planctomycetes bacterium]|nr:hypothetical protein [Planctomycetota bacterium]
MPSLDGCRGARLGQKCVTCCLRSNLNFSIDLIGRYWGILRGDMNLNAEVDFVDVEPFVSALLSGPAGADGLCARISTGTA